MDVVVDVSEAQNKERRCWKVVVTGRRDSQAFIWTVPVKLSFERIDGDNTLLANETRREIASHAVGAHAIAFVVRTLEEGFALANQIAPEHLSLNIKKALESLPRIRHAGAIFVGRYTPPAVADYVAGPNHVLPTGGSARFFSSLGVDEYVKRSNVVSYSQAALLKAKRAVIRLATLEGFDAHGQSMESRWT